jgi:hypothetical protein
MANALTLTAAAMPAAAGPLAGVIDNGNSNGVNSAAWTFANGAPGAADTIANAQLLKGVATTSRLYAFLNRTWTDQAELDGAAAALGLNVSVNGGSAFYLITAGAAKATATVTTAAATGSIRLSIAASIAQ